MNVVPLFCDKSSKVFRGEVYTDTSGFKDNLLPIAITKLLPFLTTEGNTSQNSKDVRAKFGSLGSECYHMPEEVAVIVQQLIEQTNKSIQAAYDKGKEDGKKLLIGLNNGDYTITDFDKK